LSFVDFSNFKAVSDDTIPFEAREPEDFTTAALNHSTALEFAKVCKKAKIINNDAINQIVFRVHSNRGTARTVPPNTEITINEWFSDLFIVPDAVTGAGQLEMDLVLIQDARRVKQ